MSSAMYGMETSRIGRRRCVSSPSCIILSRYL
jgi:hypothetical protein